ncbi:DUF1330 domain-containing protein [Vibrio superstes]|uniref:DUF1330 domain-containing protein n=1 Tax=Vibrio superstes NBRC 103154 TaxID=1219062 RepID=A0A511QVU3_9VIBR|nr:DUF1330 domain-containing protein [Vibrio superstes]GEM81491.1 hypothetical protein VSU01S_37360 [Vibrio superstes NBRC 103154]
MTAFFVINYDVTDQELYAQYNPGSAQTTFSTIAKHGGEIIVGTNEEISVSGTPSHVRVIIQFPTKESALAWHNDPEYADAKAIRLAATTNIEAYIVDKLVMPE